MDGLFTSIFRGMAAGPTFRKFSLNSDGWKSMLGYRKAHAGTVVDENTAMTVSAVYRSVAIISDAVSMLPLVVLRRVDDERREVRNDHPLTRLFANPNKLMNQIDLRSAIQSHALQRGSGYMEIQRTQGETPIALWPLLPDRTRPTSVENKISGERDLVYATNIEGQYIAIDPKDVLHIRGLSYDGIRGYSPIALAREGIGLALALEEYGAKFFANDAKSGGVLEHPGELSDRAKKGLQESWHDQSGLENAHRVKVAEEGMVFKATSIPPEDAQFLLTRTFQVEEIARLYGIPLHMLQSQAKTTSWGTGIAQMSLGFLIYTLSSWLIRWEQELTRKLFTEDEIDQGYYLRHNVNALLRSDPQTRASFYTAALNSSTGWMVRDEVRALEDLNPDGVENEAPAQAFAGGPPTEEPETDEEEDEEEDTE